MKEILLFEIKENIRSRWVFIYSGLLVLVMTVLSFFGDQNGTRLLISTMNLTLIVIPLFSITFSGLSFLESMPFAEILLSKSVSRNALFFGKYFGITISLSLGLLLGLGIPGIIIFLHDPHFLFLFFELITFGIFLTFIFVAIAFFLSSLLRRAEIVLTVSLLVWLYFFIFFDALIFILSLYLGDYPIEVPSLIIILLNPIDLIRILLILQTSSSALLGFSGALLLKQLGIFGVLGITVLFLSLWVTVPLLISFKRFQKRNF
jgi:Cu-processing system permease protein